MLTPLNEEGQPNESQIERLVDLFARQGLGGIYVAGSTGQWPLLTVAQRKRVLERVVKTGQGRLAIMAHVGAVATDDAVDLARHAAQVGADSVSSVTPIYYPASMDAMFEHYRRIGAATELPLFVYHLEGVSQAIDVVEYSRRLLELPHVGGMKITIRDMYLFGLLHEQLGQRLRLFSGADEVFCHAVLSGAIGAIGTFYNLWGPVCQATRAAFVAGDIDRGRRFMADFQSVIGEVLRSGSIWFFLRAAMRIAHGIEIGPPKAPLGIVEKPWRDADVEKLLAKIVAHER